MKKSRKRVLLPALAVTISLLIISLTSCTSKSPLLLRVVCMGLCGDYLEETIEQESVLPVEYNDENAAVSKSVVLPNGDAEEVFYVNSLKYYMADYAVYKSEDENVSCRYDSQTGKLLRISCKNGAVTVPDSLLNEEYYRNWTEHVFSEYGVDDFSNYRYSCETRVYVSNESSAYTDTYEYFYKDLKANESMYKRSFKYTEHVGDYATEDFVGIDISYPTGSIIIDFDQNKISDSVEVNFDKSKIREIVDSYILSNLNAEKYRFKSSSSEIIAQELVMAENEVCLQVDVAMTFVNKESGSAYTAPFTLIIFPD